MIINTTSKFFSTLCHVSSTGLTFQCINLKCKSSANFQSDLELGNKLLLIYDYSTRSKPVHFVMFFPSQNGTYQFQNASNEISSPIWTGNTRLLLLIYDYSTRSASVLFVMLFHWLYLNASISKCIHYEISSPIWTGNTSFF
jgi:hypothetical protein